MVGWFCRKSKPRMASFFTISDFWNYWISCTTVDKIRQEPRNSKLKYFRIIFVLLASNPAAQQRHLVALRDLHFTRQIAPTGISSVSTLFRSSSLQDAILQSSKAAATRPHLSLERRDSELIYDSSANKSWRFQYAPRIV